MNVRIPIYYSLLHFASILQSICFINSKSCTYMRSSSPAMACGLQALNRAIERQPINEITRRKSKNAVIFLMTLKEQ